jgi:hypothetical protein
MNERLHDITQIKDQKMQKDTQRYIKHYTENFRLRNTNPAKYRG